MTQEAGGFEKLQKAQKIVADGPCSSFPRIFAHIRLNASDKANAALPQTPSESRWWDREASLFTKINGELSASFAF
jgi:hypothetical protein